jgi:hypothetical protein
MNTDDTDLNELPKSPELPKLIIENLNTEIFDDISQEIRFKVGIRFWQSLAILAFLAMT